MDLLTLAVVVIAVMSVVSFIAFIPVALQLRKTLLAAEKFWKSMEASIKPLIEDEIKPMVRTLNGAVEDMDGVARAAREGVEKMADTLEAFKEVGGTVRSINNIIRTELKTPIVNLASWIAGAKVGARALIDALKTHKKKEVEP